MCVKDWAILVVLRTIILIVVGVGVAANGFRLRIIKVLLVEGSDALSTLCWVSFHVIRGQGAHDGQAVAVVTELINAQTLAGRGQGT